ncbi:MAG: hypothetical protein KOO69_07710, partial [Victivallales bacterium]|nr:hypothetical protein [Victivallales bacterium]
MLKRILTIAVLAAGITCFAGSGVRIDIDGVKNKILLKPGKSSKGLNVINSNKYYLLLKSAMNLSDKWQKFSFSFTPNKDGIVNIHLKGIYHKVKGAKKLTEAWVAYDNIT